MHDEAAKEALDWIDPLLPPTYTSSGKLMAIEDDKSGGEKVAIPSDNSGQEPDPENDAMDAMAEASDLMGVSAENESRSLELESSNSIEAFGILYRMVAESSKERTERDERKADPSFVPSEPIHRMPKLFPLATMCLPDNISHFATRNQMTDHASNHSTSPANFENLKGKVEEALTRYEWLQNACLSALEDIKEDFEEQFEDWKSYCDHLNRIWEQERLEYQQRIRTLDLEVAASEKLNDSHNLTLGQLRTEKDGLNKKIEKLTLRATELKKHNRYQKWHDEMRRRQKRVEYKQLEAQNDTLTRCVNNLSAKIATHKQWIEEIEPVLLLVKESVETLRPALDLEDRAVSQRGTAEV